MIDLTVSVVTGNNKKFILECLKSIYETTKNLSFEVYVVINGPSDDSEAPLKESFPDVNLIINQKKMGFTYNHNRVIEKAKGKYILVLNDDTLILNGALKKMVDFMETSPDVGILGCRILNLDGTLQWSCGKSLNHKFEYWKAGMLNSLLSPFLKDHHFKNTQEVSWVTGACLLVRNEAARAVGVFDENIIIYFEDADWCYRMIKAGWKVVFYPHAKIIHYFGQTRKKYLARDILIIYQSRLYFFSKHYSRPTSYSVRMLTIVEVILRYMKTLISPYDFPGQRGQRKELRRAYGRVIQLALAPASLRKAGSYEDRI
jgi:GT2 family glycosyltransferase